MVYFIRQSGTNYIKIGFTSRKIDKRLLEHQTSNPAKLILLGIIDGDENKEAEIHRKYWHYKSSGGSEWFELPEEIINQIVQGDLKHESNNDILQVIRDSPFDVRPVLGRQQHSITSQREDVSDAGTLFDNARDQPVRHVSIRK